MKKKNIIKYIIVGIIIFIIFVLLVMLLSRAKVGEELDLYKTSSNLVIDDSMVMTLYNRYNPERELLFNLVGSDTNKDYFGYYYRKDKITYDDLDDKLKNTILINDADYKTGEYDEDRRCYNMSVSSFKDIYDKLFGSSDYNIDFDESYVPYVYVDDANICIEDNSVSDYSNVIDTYMVNAINEDEYIIIYERVAFIEIGDKSLYFYRDYDMKDLVYKLDNIDDVDMSFNNNSQLVSNVLLEYQNEFDLYEYTYKKGVDTYYLESIER